MKRTFVSDDFTDWILVEAKDFAVEQTNTYYFDAGVRAIFAPRYTRLREDAEWLIAQRRIAEANGLELSAKTVARYCARVLRHIAAYRLTIETPITSLIAHFDLGAWATETSMVDDVSEYKKALRDYVTKFGFECNDNVNAAGYFIGVILDNWESVYKDYTVYEFIASFLEIFSPVFPIGFFEAIRFAKNAEDLIIQDRL